jgi:hypothetical protein
MFHVELRHFPHVAREFNLNSQQLQERFVGPWVAGKTIELGEHKFSQERARLTVYEGPALRADELGMGRGWGNATRGGSDVTARVLEQQPHDANELAELKMRLLDACREREIEVCESARIAGALQPGRRASERLALAEQAVWELLHAGAIRMTQDGADVGREQWQPLLLPWSTWAGTAAQRVRIGGSA